MSDLEIVALAYFWVFIFAVMSTLLAVIFEHLGLWDKFVSVVWRFFEALMGGMVGALGNE